MKELQGIDLILFLVFLTLKLTNTITWSWWLVFLPLYFVPALLVIIGLFIGTCFAIYKIKE